MPKFLRYGLQALMLAFTIVASPVHADPNWRENMTATYAPCPDKLEDAVWVPGWIITENLLGEMRILPDRIRFTEIGDYPITAHKTPEGDTYYEFGRIFERNEAIRENMGEHFIPKNGRYLWLETRMNKFHDACVLVFKACSILHTKRPGYLADLCQEIDLFTKEWHKLFDKLNP